MKEIIAMKKKRLELEERKVKALERIASALEGHQGQSCTEFSVSPIIKFNYNPAAISCLIFFVYHRLIMISKSVLSAKYLSNIYLLVSQYIFCGVVDCF